MPHFVLLPTLGELDEECVRSGRVHEFGPHETPTSVPDGWPTWPLQHVIRFFGVPRRELPQAYREAIRRAVSEGRLALPAHDNLPHSQSLCHESLLRLARAVATNGYFGWDPWRRKITLLPGMCENEYPALYATESARMRAKTRMRARSSEAAWNEAPERLFGSCLAWAPDASRPMLTISNATLYREVWWRGGRVGSFPTALACALYSVTNARRVLDISAGWGDRLAAALASPTVEAYWGVDPNPHVHPGYARLIAGARALGKDPSQFRCVCAGTETIAPDSGVLGDESFDLVFTSPPYWNQEEYDPHPESNAGQSIVAYPTLDRWLGEFWPRYVDTAIRRLAPGGKLALDMHDAPSKTDPWVGRARAVLDADPRLAFSGVISCERSHAPVPLPVWVWTRANNTHTDTQE